MKDTLLAEIEALEASAPEIRTTPKKVSESKTPKRTGRPADPNSSLPRVFDSINQCSSVCGIPVPALRAAKKAGCPAFRHSRVDLIAFLTWRFGLAEDAVEDWGAELSKFKAKREGLKLAQDEQRVIDRSVVQTALARGMSLLFQKIDNEFALMLPPMLKGLPEIEIQKKLLEAAETFKSTLRDELKALATVVADKPAQSIQQPK